MKEKHKFPLIYTSKSVSAEKRVLAFVKNSDENLSCSEDISRKSEGKVAVNFLGLFLAPLRWSNLFWPTPFWVALLKQHLQGGPPASSLYRNLEEVKRKKSMEFLLMSLQDAVSRRPKDFFKIPADSPHASIVSKKGEVMDISERL